MPQTVKLMNCVFYAHHGVMQEEHRVGGKYAVDVEMKIDFEAAAQTDKLDHTVDYEIVYNILKELIVTQKKYLIESLSRQIAMTVLDRFPKITDVLVRVRKMNPPVGGVCDFAEVEYQKSRQIN